MTEDEMYGPAGLLSRFTKAANGIHAVAEQLREQQHQRDVKVLAERAAIVAWLRELAGLMRPNQASILEHAARNISLGAHLPHLKGGIDGQ